MSQSQKNQLQPNRSKAGRPKTSRPKPKRPKTSRRQRRIWISVAAMAGGLLLVAAAGSWLEQTRNTDLEDASDAVTALDLETAPADAPEFRFRNVAAEVGINLRQGPAVRSRILPEDTGAGLAWGDVDGDGDFDLYIVNFPGDSEESGEVNWNRLYRNDGEGFTDITGISGTADPRGFGMGASFADFDDDGDKDLYVTNWGPNRLFRNRGDGTFEEVAGELGVADPRWSVATAWGDFDRDGLLDLYVTNYVDFAKEQFGNEDLASDGTGLAVDNPSWEGIPLSLNPNAFEPQPNSLFRQLPGGSFEEVALTSGVSNPRGRSLAATAVDLDGDGWLDLYVANDVSPNSLFLNLGARFGEALFEDASSFTGTADPRGSMGISVTDLEDSDGTSDGRPDLFITHWIAQENALYRAVEEGRRRLEYRDKTRQLGLGEISTERVGWGCAFVDLDLDGRRDLVVANGSTLEDGSAPPELQSQAPFLFWNAVSTGNGKRFVDLAPLAGEDFGTPRVARGLAAADFDQDGDVDLAIAINRGRPLLLRNETPNLGSWLAVRLEGPSAASFGARLELTSGDSRQVLWWGADVSFASGHAPEAVFGLGPSKDPARLTVAWLGGALSELSDLVPGQRITVVHPDTHSDPRSLKGGISQED